MTKAQSAAALVPIKYGWRGMGPSGLAVVRGWLTEPHVARRWPNPQIALRSITQHLSEPAIERFILTIDGRDASYLQVYDPHHAPPPAADEQTSDHPYRGQRGIDLFIGEARLIGRGHASRLIRRILEHLRRRNTPRGDRPRSRDTQHRRPSPGPVPLRWATRSPGGTCSSCAATISNKPLVHDQFFSPRDRLRT